MLKNRLCFLFMISCLSLTGQTRSMYTVHGTLSDSLCNGSYAYLLKCSVSGNSITYLDSAKIIENKFTFKGITNGKPDLYNISIPNYSNSWIVFEPGEINIICSKGILANVSGTPINEQLNKDIIEPSNELSKEIFLRTQKRAEAIKRGEWTTDDEIQYNKSFPLELIKKLQDRQIHFIKKNIEYPVIEKFLFHLIMTDDKAVEDILPKLSEITIQKLYQEKSEVLKMAEKLTGAHQIKENIPETVQVGKQYADFKGRTINGDTIIFSNLIKDKKLILLDFWASWCTPCIKEMPTIIDIYNQYKNIGLEIVGISLDIDDLSWEKAIEKNKMTWIQIINLKNDDNQSIQDIYGIKMIPYTILIDQNGKIVARNLRGDELRKKIEHFIKQ